MILLGLLCVIIISCEQRNTIDTFPARHISASPAAMTLYADTAKSILTFIGQKNFVGTEQEGFFKLKSGIIFLDANGIPKGGKFIWDINSIKFVEADSITKQKLTSALLSESFFKIERYPESIFLIDKFQKLDSNGFTHLVSGNLQIGDTYRYTSIPATITSVNNYLYLIKSEFDIDRSDWNLFFVSKNSFENKIVMNKVHISLMVGIVKNP